MMRSQVGVVICLGSLALAVSGALRKPPPAQMEQRVAFGPKINARKELHFNVEKLEGTKVREVVTCVSPEGATQRLICKGETITMKARSHEETLVFCEDMSGAQRTLVCQGSPQAVGYPKKVGWEGDGSPCNDYHNCPEYKSGKSDNADWGNEYPNPQHEPRSFSAGKYGTSVLAMLSVLAAGVLLG